MNPDIKTGVLLRYKTGLKDQVIHELFDRCFDGKGVMVLITGLGLSRLYTSPESFPQSTQYAPGHEGYGFTFVKYEPVA
jgi:hypothetical protein